MSSNVIQGNFIGTDTTGLLALGNTNSGVTFSITIGNTIGGTGAGQGNVIAFTERRDLHFRGQTEPGHGEFDLRKHRRGHQAEFGGEPVSSRACDDIHARRRKHGHACGQVNWHSE